MGNVWIVFLKESIDNLRDRRSLYLALFYPVIGALLLGLLVSFVGGMFRGQGSQSLSLPIQGAERAPQLIVFLRGKGIKILEAPADPGPAVRAGKVDAVLVIPKGHAENFA
ncbi:MAG: ABC transporter permease, partial [Alphaproteobacteria bacterium]